MNLEELLDFVREEVEAQELSTMLRKSFASAPTKSKQDKESSKPKEEESMKAPGGGSNSTAGAFSVEAGSRKGDSKKKKEVATRKEASKWPKRNCLFDGEEHPASRCSLPLAAKMDFIKKESRCIKCLGKNHKPEECTRGQPCYCCGDAHHTSLCPKRVTPVVAKTITLSAFSVANKDVLLMTATLSVLGIKFIKKLFCLIDGGSQRTFIRQQIAVEMGLDRIGLEELSIRPFGSLTGGAPSAHQIFGLLARGTFPEATQSVYLSAIGVKEIGKMPAARRIALVQELRRDGYRLADDRFLTDGESENEIDILIGADFYYNVVGMNETKRSSCGLQVVASIFGWLLHGPLERSTSSVNINPMVNMIVMNVPGDNEMNEERFDLAAFHSLESLGITESGAIEKKTDFLQQFRPKIKRRPDGGFMVPLTWNEGRMNLQPNRKEAEACLNSLLKKLVRNPELLKAYHEQMEQYMEAGFVSEASEEYDGPLTYLPHHPVIRPDKLSTPMRPVFNGSARFKGGPSLNDCLHIGPNLNPELLAVLLRFRQNKIAWIADLKKAFLQIQLEPQDADTVRFLWINDITNPLESKKVPRKWDVVPFGLGPSPFLLRAVVEELLDTNGSRFPNATQHLKENLFVDDWLGGAQTVEEAARMAAQATTIFEEGQFRWTKWATNDPELRSLLPNGEKDAKADGALGIVLGGEGDTKVLGLCWNQEDDVFYFNPEHIVAEAAKYEYRITKRQLLRTSSRIFDPCGFLSPITVCLKILFQKVWEADVGWDEPVPDKIRKPWSRHMEQLKAIEALRIPRWARWSGLQGEVQVFCDASEAAYGAVVYARKDSTDQLRIVASKTKVSSRKPKMTLPRLELMGALLAARLSNYFLDALSSIQWKVTFWTDSQVALGWIQGDPYRWKDFVKNRVDSIRVLTKPSSWHHCPGILNPADLASRGVSAPVLVDSSCWWNGPPMERLVANRPAESADLDGDVAAAMKEEEKKNVLATTIATSTPILQAHRYSSFNRLVRTVAWRRRPFLLKKDKERFQDLTAVDPVCLDWRRKQQDRVLNVKCLTVEEIIQAEQFVLRVTQTEAFPNLIETLMELKEGELPKLAPKLGPLRPYLDKDTKLVRVVGRIELAFEAEGSVPPILLPDKHPVTDLIIRQAHHQVLHAGTRATLTHLRETYWIVRGRQQVKRVINSCVICKKLNSRSFDELPACLPLERVREADPFQNVGVDFAGPLYVRPFNYDEIKRANPGEPMVMEKTYIALFTCAVTRAVHLELVPNLTTTEFLLTLRAFIGRRGVPSVIYSDNAPTFKQTSRFLQALQSDPKVNDYLADHHIKWKFSANLAPWWGGFWERMVATTKAALIKTLGNANVTFRQLQVLLIEVEAAVNSRPLTYLSDEVDEPTPLTPSHLVSGRRLTTLPEAPAVEVTPDWSNLEGLVRREAKRRRILNAFVKRWRTEYMHDLTNFHAPGSPNRSVQPGEIVLVHHPTLKRQRWPMAIVERVVEGQGGRARLVDLKMGKNTLTNRPIQRLHPLELQLPPDSVFRRTDPPSDDASSEPSEELIMETPTPVDGSAGEDVGNYEATTRSGRHVRARRRLISE